jgi:hypothetical protein
VGAIFAIGLIAVALAGFDVRDAEVSSSMLEFPLRRFRD